MSNSVEDWLGSNLDKAPEFRVNRAFNGITVSDMRQSLLVFQDMTHFQSWFNTWFKETEAK